MTTTTDIGYAKQKQYQSGAHKNPRRRHSVRKDERDRWVTVCKGKPATREYKGWLETVDCKACRKSMGVES